MELQEVEKQSLLTKYNNLWDIDMFILMTLRSNFILTLTK